MAKSKYCIKMIYIRQILSYYNKEYKDELKLWESMTTRGNETVYYKGRNIAIVIEREYGRSNRVFVSVCNYGGKMDGKIISFDVWRMISYEKIEFYSKNTNKSQLVDYDVYEQNERQLEGLSVAYNELLKRYNELLQDKQSEILDMMIALSETRDDISKGEDRYMSEPDIKDKQKKKYSKHKGGRQKMFTENQVAEIKEKLDAGVSITDVAQQFNVSRQTIYKYLKKM